MSRAPHDNGPSDRPGAEDGGLGQARVKVSRWRGWVWAVPIGALIFLTWMLLRSFVFTAPEVAVTFPDATGIGPGTPVRLKGVKVGSIQSVTLSEDLSRARAVLRIEGPPSDYLREGARFWVARPSLASGEFSGLLAGAHVAMAAGAPDGKKRDVFEALPRPPVGDPSEPGTVFTLIAEEAEVARGAPVATRGIRVGRVVGVELRPAERRVEISAFVRAPYDGMVSEATRFWRAGGMTLSLDGGGPSADIPPIGTLLGGGIAFGLGDGSGPPPESARFALHASREAAETAPAGPRLAYRVLLEGGTKGVAPGAAVTLGGLRIGSVTAVDLALDPARGTVNAPVTFEIAPLALGVMPGAGLRTRTNEALARLVERGLRVRAGGGLLGGSLGGLGGAGLELAVLEDAEAATFLTRTVPPRLPAAPGGGGVGSILDNLDAVAAKLETLPLGQIARNLKEASAAVESLAEDPDIRESIDSLNAALADLEVMTGRARGDIGPAVESLEQTAAAAEDLVRSVDRLMGGTVRQNRDLPELIEELTRTARSIRTLTGYLSRQPEALIEGRDGD